MRILLIEDDPQIGSGVQAGLRLEGFIVDWVRDGAAAWHELELAASHQTDHYSACVLDLGLPRLGGQALLQQVRQRTDWVARLPILVLTAQADIRVSVQCLDMGADDYVTKPAEISLIAARLRALIRRQGRLVESVLRASNGLCLDLQRREVSIDDQVVDLSGKEFLLLQALMLSQGKILTRDQLSARLYEWGQEIKSNAIEVHMYHLRKKLGTQGEALQTVRGLGYRLKV